MRMYRVLFAGILAILLTGCPIDGDDGIDCWDVNENGINDAEEDTNNDGIWDVSDCSDNTSQTVTQNSDIELNHQHLCEAFANLGQYPEGCPSASYTAPTGTLTIQTSSTLNNDGNDTWYSCDLPPNNGSLALEPMYNSYYWTLEGGYIANRTTIATMEQWSNDTCFTTCESDGSCVASYAEVSTSLDSVTCYHFYHSDTIDPWQHLCGNEASQCLEAMHTDQMWSVKCP